jgi:EpsI family protein
VIPASRWQVLAGAMGIFLVAGIVFTREHVIPPRLTFDRFPEFPGYQSEFVPVSNEALRVLKLTDYLSRNFRDPDGRAINLYVGYHGKQVRGGAIHSPTLCLPANGWYIVSLESVPMPGRADGPAVNRMVVGHGDARQLVYYWYQGRGHVASSEYESLLRRTLDVALYGRSDEALVRFGTAGDDEAADRALRAFIERVVPELDPFVPV